MSQYLPSTSPANVETVLSGGLVSWHHAITETPQLRTVAQMLAQPITYSTPNKRMLPPSLINPIQAGPGAGIGPVPNGFFYQVNNVTVTDSSQAQDGEAFTFNNVLYDDQDINIVDPSLPSGQLQGIHCEADMNWKLNRLTSMTDYPNIGQVISVQGYSYYDDQHIAVNLGAGREIHALTAWRDAAGIIHMVL